MLRLNTRIWAFVPTKCVEGIESLMLLGNTVTLTGTPRHNGRREILYVSKVEQNSVIDLQKVINKLKLIDSVNATFLAYLYVFRPTFYKKFVTWSHSRKSSYFANPFKLYLNGHLDYYTSKGLADVTAIRDKEKIIPAVIKYLLEDAQYAKKEYTPQMLLDAIRTKYPDNGTIGEVKAISGKFYRIQANGTAFWCKDGDFSLAYALTVHRAQGSEWDYVIVILPNVTKEGLLTEELKQVAFTRARAKTFIFEEKDDSKTVKEVNL